MPVISYCDNRTIFNIFLFYCVFSSIVGFLLPPKDKNEGYTVKFKLLENKKSYTTSTKNCHLSTAEKYLILFADLPNMLNTKSEIMSKCRHKRKFKLTS